MQAYGWGYTKSGDVTGSDILQEVSVTVVTPELCQKTLDSYCQTHWDGKDCVVLTDGMLCAGSPGKDTCQVCKTACQSVVLDKPSDLDFKWRQLV